MHLGCLKSKLKRTAVDSALSSSSLCKKRHKLAPPRHAAILPISALLIEPKMHFDSTWKIILVPVCGRMCLHIYVFICGLMRVLLVSSSSPAPSTAFILPLITHEVGEWVKKENGNTRNILAVGSVVPLKAPAHYCNGV